MDPTVDTISKMWPAIYGVGAIVVLLAGAIVGLRSQVTYLQRDNESNKAEISKLRDENREERHELRKELTKVSFLVQRIAERLKIIQEEEPENG
jgi:predicted Holliday junction resolvase-like endonuclease